MPVRWWLKVVCVTAITFGLCHSVVAFGGSASSLVAISACITLTMYGLCCGGTKVVRCLGLAPTCSFRARGGGVMHLSLDIVPHTAGQRCACTQLSTMVLLVII